RDEGASALAGSPGAANLRMLWLHNNALTPACLKALASSPHLGKLRYLGLCGNHALHDGRDDRATLTRRLRTLFRLPRLLSLAAPAGRRRERLRRSRHGPPPRGDRP